MTSKPKMEHYHMLKACEEASKIPPLTDHSFYTNMIDANKDKFGSKKQLQSEEHLNETYFL